MAINSLFSNYELSKLDIPCPTFQNILILSLIGIAISLTLRKKDSVFLDQTQTDQMKGLGIILIVVGHLWYHVSQNKAVPILGDYSVTLFLILSGFGLTLSCANKRFSLKEFIVKRLSKVLIPYWIVTILILYLDAQLLDRHYGTGQIVRTFLGLNIEKQLVYLDYTRWYITLLLLYYLAFAVTYKAISGNKRLVCLGAFGLVLVILRIPKLLTVGMVDQIIAFPLGCALANYRGLVCNAISGKNRFQSVGTIVICFVTASLFVFLYRDSTFLMAKAIVSAVTRINSLFFCAFVILFMDMLCGQKNRASSLLAFCAAISYEIYLIHGPLLIKYDPILKLLPSSAIVLTLALFLALIIIASYGLHLAIGWLVPRTEALSIRVLRL